MSYRLENHPLKHFKKDLPASLVVFLVALPYCLGIAAGSDSPPITGLIAGVVGGIIVGFLSGSNLGVSGPAAGLTPIILIFKKDLPLSMDEKWGFLLLVFVVAGVFQLIFAAIKAGVVTDYFPNNVIKGMLAGIGVILFLKQIPHALGNDADPEGDSNFELVDGHNTFTDIYDAVINPHLGAITVFSISLLVLIVWRTKKLQQISLIKYIPAPLLVVVIGVIASVSFQGVNGFQFVGDHLIRFDFGSNGKGFIDSIVTPDWSALYENKEGYKSLKVQWQAIISMAITISVVGSLETLLSLEAVDKLDPKKRMSPPNRELWAQGIGNLISAMIGGLPITQVVVRSSANVDGGGQTKMSTMIHGVLFFVCIFSMGPLLNMIPKACLAAILVMIAYRLTNPVLYKELWEMGLRQFMPFIITILIIVFSGLLEGIVIGLIFAIYFILRDNRNNEPFDVIVRRAVEDGFYYKVVINFHEEVTYLSKHVIKQSLLEIPDNSKVVIDLADAIYLSHEVTEVIDEYVESLSEERNVAVEVKGIEFDLKEIDDQLLRQMI